MKTIDTLISDIQELLLNGSDDIPEEVFDNFGKRMGELLKQRLGKRDHNATSLRMSNIGSPCARKLWYVQNHKDRCERPAPDTYMKFLYGDIIEELLLFLTKATGHKVVGEQTELEIKGVTGHRDAIIDGVLVDVKSVSSYAFKKHKANALEEDDPFGYIPQLHSYLHASQDDPELIEKDRFAFFVMDKTLGHIHLDFYDRIEEWDIENSYQNRIEIVNSDTPPERAFEPQAKGSSGNKGLGVFCSYCEAKKLCHPNLRTFIYSSGPEYLTTVKRTPNVPESNE